MSLPYRPDLWRDPKTGRPTPHRAALGYLYKLVEEGCPDWLTPYELLLEFRFFSSYRNADRFVARNRWRAERYIHQHERIRASKDRNFTAVLAALKRAGAAKARELKVMGQGRGGRHATYLSSICIERHLRRARKAGLVTVDRYGVWRLVGQADLLTAAFSASLDPQVKMADPSYQPDLTKQPCTQEDLPVDQANASNLDQQLPAVRKSRAEIANSLTQFPSTAREPDVPADSSREFATVDREHAPAFSEQLADHEPVPALSARSVDHVSDERVIVDCGRERERFEYVPIDKLMRVLTETLERLGVKPVQPTCNETRRDDDEAFSDEDCDDWVSDEYQEVSFIDPSAPPLIVYDEKRNCWIATPEPECVRYDPARDGELGNDKPEFVRWVGA